MELLVAFSCRTRFLCPALPGQDGILLHPHDLPRGLRCSRQTVQVLLGDGSHS